MSRLCAPRNSTYELSVADKLSCEPEERLLEVVVGLGRDVVVLEVLLAVESDGLGLDLALLDIDLVAGQDNGDVLANANEITCVEISQRSWYCMSFRDGVWFLRCQLGTFL